MTESTDRSLSLYLKASLTGAVRGAFGLIFEHPFDTVKTRCQAQNAENSVRQVSQKIFETQGVKGLYSGWLPNGIRLMSKQIYRWPMMLAFPQFYKEHLPNQIQVSYPSSAKLATALSIAHLETFIICPLERLKVYLMTADHQKKGIGEFFQNHRKQIGQEMLRGINAVYFRQITSWVSFLLTDEKMKNWERRRIQQQELPFLSLMRVSLGVGIINTAVNMPFDTAKTQMQMVKHVNATSVFSVMRKIYQSGGVKALYAGWQVRMIQYMIQSVVTVPALDYFEQQLVQKKRVNSQ